MKDETRLEAHFEFGRNWSKLVEQIDEQRVAAACADIRAFIGSELEGRHFLDIGCGSGLTSLAAYRLGASRITSVDIDPVNIRNTDALKAKFGVPQTFPWEVRTASIVAAADVGTLPRADVVCSWGVLHHTGAMWQAISNAASRVEPGGLLYLMLYRDSVFAPVWKRIKWAYVKSPAPLKFLMRGAFASVQVAGMLAEGKNPKTEIQNYGKSARGMSWFVDSTDWLGGYPFEYAEAEQVISFLQQAGFELRKLYPEITPRTLGLRGTGSYQYLFQKTATPG